MSGERMTAEYEARIRAWVDSLANVLPRDREIGHRFTVDLLRELDAVRAERDEARKERDELDTANSVLHEELEDAYDTIADLEAEP